MTRKMFSILISLAMGLFFSISTQAAQSGAKTMDDSINQTDSYKMSKNEFEIFEEGKEIDEDRRRYGNEYRGDFQTGDTIRRGIGIPQTSLEPKRPILLQQSLNSVE